MAVVATGPMQMTASARAAAANSSSSIAAIALLVSEYAAHMQGSQGWGCWWGLGFSMGLLLLWAAVTDLTVVLAHAQHVSDACNGCFCAVLCAGV